MKHIYKLMVASCLMLFLTSYIEARNATTSYGLNIGDITMQHIGNRMEVDFTIFIEGVKIRSSHSLRITPYITNGNEIMQLSAVIIDGRRRHIVHERHRQDMVESPNTYIRRYNHKAQIVDYQTDVPFEAWMSNSELILQEEWLSCHDVAYAEDATPVASLNEEAKKLLDTKAASKQAQKAYITPSSEPAKEIEALNIFFPVNKSNISDTYMDNSTQISELGKVLKSNNDIKSILLTGYASPEGPYPFNTALATKRAEAVKKHLAQSNLSPSISIESKAAPIDWEELKKWLTDSYIENSRDIVAIIDDSTIKPADKNNAIKQKYPVAYDFMLNNWYPKLRKTTIAIDGTAKKMSLEQAKAQLKSDPSKLPLEDIYMIALTYQKGSKEWNDIIILAVENYPNSVEARINAANVAMSKGDYQQAAQYLNGIPANIPQAMNSRGILAMAQGKYQEAMQLFQGAEKAGVSEAAYNISLLKELMAANN